LHPVFSLTFPNKRATLCIGEILSISIITLTNLTATKSLHQVLLSSATHSHHQSGGTMSETPSAGIYLIVEFDWPESISKEQGQNAAQLHAVVQNQTWIKEAVAASGGIGGGPSCIWIFWLENYAALDRLLHDKADDVCQTYLAFFSEMPVVHEKIREKVVFL
jgi:hypothetical protein